VWRWKRETSGTGYMRLGFEPNKRVQDGLKRHWLCRDCEERFSRVESEVARKLFYPYAENSTIRVRYGGWLMKFGISVVWRVLRYYTDEGHLGNYPAEQMVHVQEAETTWRTFLLDQRPHPGRFHLHLLPLDGFASVPGDNVPPNMNRYVTRAVDFDVVDGGSTAYVYAKLGRLLFLGFTRLDHPSQWIGTRINSNQGIIEPRNYRVPHPFGEYMKEKAARMLAIMQSISPRQQEKIDETFWQTNPEKLANSDLFRAMAYDVEMFGAAAFRKPRE
jgi:hypothetical protein